MGTQHFQLIFKRSQTDASPPTFSLLVVADMSPAFVHAARHYGLWNQIVYADPKLKEARDMRAREAEARERQRQRAGSKFLKTLTGPNASIVFPAWVTLEIMKLVWLGPFKLAWWIWCAIRTQRTQILRLRELEPGKIIATNTLTEIKEAEKEIQRTVEEFEDYLREACVYDGHAFEPERSPAGTRA